MVNKKCANLRKKVLIVDDEIELADIISEVVKICGFTPVIASNGLEGLVVLSVVDISLVISDIHMPVMNGIDFLSEVRSRGFATPFVFITAVGTKEIVINALRMGVFDFLDKPFDLDHISSVIMDGVKIKHELDENPKTKLKKKSK